MGEITLAFGVRVYVICISAKSKVYAKTIQHMNKVGQNHKKAGIKNLVTLSLQPTDLNI